MNFEWCIDGVLGIYSLKKKGENYIFSDGEGTREADIQPVSPNIYSIKIGERSIRAYLVRDNDKLFIQIDGCQFLVSAPARAGEGFQRAGEQSQEDVHIVKAPMPGKVIKVNVSEGDKVRKNQTLAIVEAMKMENEIKAPFDGSVKIIHCKPGDLVETQNPLIELE